MRLKLSFKFLIAAPLVFLLMQLTGCVEKPTIDPIGHPYAALRVVNLGANTGAVNITIDGAAPIAGLTGLANGAITSYFDLMAGEHSVVIKDAANGQTLLTKNVIISSWDRQTIMVSGYGNSTGATPDTLNTFGIYEGKIYWNFVPGPDSSYIRFIHALPNPPGVADTPFDSLRVMAFNTTTGDSVSLTTGFRFSTRPNRNLAAGTYRIEFRQGPAAGGPVLSTQNVTLTARLRYWLWVSGTPEAPVFTLTEETPPATRSK